MATQQATTLLRSIGNVFRRPEANDNGDHSLTPDSVTLASSFLNAKRFDGGETIESPDLYYEDRPLGISIHTLEQIRATLRNLTACTNTHASMLVSSAGSHRELGHSLMDAMQPSPMGGTSPDANGDAPDLADLAVTSVRTDAQENVPSHHFSSYLSSEAIQAQAALGRGMTMVAEVSNKLSNAITAPINELTKSFEHRYARKIVPLRKRYIDQKGQYLKYKRNADMSDTDEKRGYYEALAEAAKPVWLRTSTELRTEADVMTELTAKNMAQWSRTIALQHERAFAISAANMAEAFTLAKELPSLGKQHPAAK